VFRYGAASFFVGWPWIVRAISSVLSPDSIWVDTVGLAEGKRCFAAGSTHHDIAL